MRATHSCIVAALLLLSGNVFGQIPSFHDISRTIEVGTVAVAFDAPKAETLDASQLATRENLTLLANIRTLCVLPYDGFKAKEIINSLPAFDLIREDLKVDKQLRQLRNEAAQQLVAKGFQVADCLANPPVSADAEVVFTNVHGGFGKTDLLTFYWVLYGPQSSTIIVHGEKELLGLARPAAIWLPLSIEAMAEQVAAVVNAAKRANDAH
jgi:hypothetical protein